MGLLILSFACFLSGCIATWVVVSADATRALSRVTDRNQQRIGALGEELRLLRAGHCPRCLAEDDDYETVS